MAGRSCIVIDFPDPGTKAKNRAEEDRLGLSRAYLCEYPAESLMNWQRNERGEFDWVVLRTRATGGRAGGGRRGDRDGGGCTTGKEEYQVYQQGERKGQAGPVELVKEGVHGLAGQKRGAAGGVQLRGGDVADEQGGARCNWSISTSRTRWGGR